jgi:hypothetical protein
MQERILNCATIGVANSTDIRGGATAEVNRLFGKRYPAAVNRLQEMMVGHSGKVAISTEARA